MTSLYGFQTSSVDWYTQNGVLSTRITSSMGPRPHLWICARKTVTLGSELQVSMAPRPHVWICARKTACLAPILQVSMGPRPYLWI